MQKIRVFVDTNVIIESFRTGCWAAICNHFAIETVAKCVEETLSGDPNAARHVAVLPAELKSGIASLHPVSRKELITLTLNNPLCDVLDDGEKHLFAWLFANKLLPSNVIVVTTADKAALKASNGLGWLDYMCSLECLARKAGASQASLAGLASQYRNSWLSSTKTKIILGISL